MSIAAANVVPSFHNRKSISVEDLPRVSEPCVVFEYEGHDSDGVAYWVYTVGGWLDGQLLGDQRGGVTVGRQAIVINALNRQHADFLASDGLETTINAQATDAQRHTDALESQARLSTVGALERMRLAQAPAADKSDAFVKDADAIRPLIGDDILLTVNGRPN